MALEIDDHGKRSDMAGHPLGGNGQGRHPATQPPGTDSQGVDPLQKFVFHPRQTLILVMFAIQRP